MIPLPARSPPSPDIRNVQRAGRSWFPFVSAWRRWGFRPALRQNGPASSVRPPLPDDQRIVQNPEVPLPLEFGGGDPKVGRVRVHMGGLEAFRDLVFQYLDNFVQPVGVVQGLPLPDQVQNVGLVFHCVLPSMSR